MPASIFSETELARLASFPEEIPGDDLIRAFTLTGADRDLVAIRRGAANRLGLALQLCALRYLGFVPRNLSAAPRSAACFVADQLEVSPDEIQSYARREQTRFTALHRGSGTPRLLDAPVTGLGRTRSLAGSNGPLSTMDAPKVLFRLARERLRTERLVFPAPDRIVRLVSSARGRAQERTYTLVEPLLRWIENPDYRRRIHRQLNKGEALHALRRFLFFAHEGKVQRRQADQQTNQVLCLNLVTNAIVTWNTVYMNAAIERLRAEGRIGRDIDLGHLSAALYGHVNPYGKYRFEIEGRAPSLRPLRSPGNNA